MSHTEVPDIPGAAAVVAWFGYWPTFHDAEVLELHVRRRGTLTLSLHTWRLSDKRYEEDGKQFIVLEKHAVVTFEMSGKVRVELGGLDNENVLGCLDVERVNGTFRFKLWYVEGLVGQIEAPTVRVSIAPGEAKGG